MNNKGTIQEFASDEEAKKAGYHVELTDNEVKTLKQVPEHKRVDVLKAMRAKILAERLALPTSKASPNFTKKRPIKDKKILKLKKASKRKNRK
jgi:hypothetical protein